MPISSRRHEPTHSLALGRRINTDLTARTDVGPVVVVDNGLPRRSMVDSHGGNAEPALETDSSGTIDFNDYGFLLADYGKPKATAPPAPGLSPYIIGLVLRARPGRRSGGRIVRLDFLGCGSP